MMQFTKEMVDDYAAKLLIGLSDAENKKVLDEFDIIKANMDKINEIPNIKDVIPMTHALDEYIISLREDEDDTSEAIEDILRNSDITQDREIEVPKVVG